ncbi:MAG: hypothetical protein IJR03_07630 [Bacteroidales bacterium]|nr:hypothetical protein [Bacteroidales bacterium]
MSRKSVLAKILFLFFAVISLGLVTVSCSDDDEGGENYCDDCSTEIIESNRIIKSDEYSEEDVYLLVKNNMPIIYYSSIGVFYQEHYYYVCNPSKIKLSVLDKAKRNKNGVKLKGIMGNVRELKEGEDTLHTTPYFDSTQDIEIIEIEY